MFGEWQNTGLLFEQLGCYRPRVHMVLSRSIFISFLSGLHVRLRASTDTHVYSKNCTRQTHDLHVCSPRVDVSVSHKCSVFLKPHARCCIGTRTVKHPHSRLFAMRCVTLFASSCETRRYPLAIVALSASRHRVGSQSECILLYRALGRVRSSLGRPPAKGVHCVCLRHMVFPCQMRR